MKKLFSILLCLALVLCAAALAEGGSVVGQRAPDFNVTTCDGEALSIYDLLEEKDLVVLNVFTSWCPPCRMEFPDMQSVYEALSDRIEIVAVSGEPDDTDEIIADYRDELGLTFPMGLDANLEVSRFLNLEGYPTTVMIDKSGNIGFMQVGMFMSAASFQNTVEYFLGDDYDGTPAGAFNVYVCDQDEHPVPGATISFCTDETCLPLVTDDSGIISFAAKPETYHLQVLKLPEGCSIEDGFEAECTGDGEWVIVQVQRDPGCICD